MALRAPVPTPTPLLAPASADASASRSQPVAPSACAAAATAAAAPAAAASGGAHAAMPPSVPIAAVPQAAPPPAAPLPASQKTQQEKRACGQSEAGRKRCAEVMMWLSVNPTKTLYDSPFYDEYKARKQHSSSAAATASIVPAVTTSPANLSPFVFGGPYWTREN